MEQNMEKELRGAGILGKTTGETTGETAGEAGGSTQPFVAHPHKYFHLDADWDSIITHGRLFAMVAVSITTALRAFCNRAELFAHMFNGGFKEGACRVAILPDDEVAPLKYLYNGYTSVTGNHCFPAARFSPSPPFPPPTSLTTIPFLAIIHSEFQASALAPGSLWQTSACLVNVERVKLRLMTNEREGLCGSVNPGRLGV
ncbi:hypothetical protein O988_06940 [Pseudogymnoascus sp. VKM F-3808]|nr:hypothetical protein O988_06940 [Pseudogymnoascus sp. VKM F-3808]